MLQEGTLRRWLFSRGSEGLELLFLPGAPIPVHSIYCVPSPRPAPPSFCPVTRRQPWFLTRRWSRIGLGQPLAGQACFHFSGATGSEATSAL